MFLEPPDYEEIHYIVTHFSLKRSRLLHDIYMYCTKYTIANITKPLMHICYLSLGTGIFPDEMKIASYTYIQRY